MEELNRFVIVSLLLFVYSLHIILPENPPRTSIFDNLSMGCPYYWILSRNNYLKDYPLQLFSLAFSYKRGIFKGKILEMAQPLIPEEKIVFHL